MRIRRHGFKHAAHKAVNIETIADNMIGGCCATTLTELILLSYKQNRYR